MALTVFCITCGMTCNEKLHVSGSHTAGTWCIPTRCSSVTTLWSGSRVWTGLKRLWVNILFSFLNIQTVVLSICVPFPPPVTSHFPSWSGVQTMWRPGHRLAHLCFKAFGIMAVTLSLSHCLFKKFAKIKQCFTYAGHFLTCWFDSNWSF